MGRGHQQASSDIVDVELVLDLHLRHVNLLDLLGLLGALLLLVLGLLLVGVQGLGLGALLHLDQQALLFGSISLLGLLLVLGFSALFVGFLTVFVSVLGRPKARVIS